MNIGLVVCPVLDEMESSEMVSRHNFTSGTILFYLQEISLPRKAEYVSTLKMNSNFTPPENVFIQMASLTGILAK